MCLCVSILSVLSSLTLYDSSKWATGILCNGNNLSALSIIRLRQNTEQSRSALSTLASCLLIHVNVDGF